MFTQDSTGFFNTDEGKKFALAVDQALSGELICWHIEGKFGGDFLIIRRPPTEASFKETLLKKFSKQANTEAKRRRLEQAVNDIFNEQKPMGLLGITASALEEWIWFNLNSEIEASEVEFAAPVYEALRVPYKGIARFARAARRSDGELQIIQELRPGKIVERRLKDGVVEKRIIGKPGNKPNFTKSDFARAVLEEAQPTRENVARKLGCTTRALSTWCKQHFQSPNGEHFKKAKEECHKYLISRKVTF